ncbi:MAG: BrnT family toxin [Chlorobiales bacterium]|nr:BrnT family toxin [Chlorobiales bacterium]
MCRIASRLYIKYIYNYGYRISMVCHCYRESDEVIRIISARKATKRETKFYRGN